MARVITFYVPDSFRPKVKWTSNRARKTDRVSLRAIAKDRLGRRLIMASITQSFRNLGRALRNSSFNLLLAWYEATRFTPTYFRSL